MKKNILLLFVTFTLLMINGCEINPTDRPYIKEIKLSPTDYLDPTTTSTKIVYTIENPVKISFNGKIFLEYNEKCIRSAVKETEIEVDKESSNSGTMIIERFSIIDECYGEQQIIIRLSEKNKQLIYDTEQLTLKLIK